MGVNTCTNKQASVARDKMHKDIQLNRHKENYKTQQN